MIHFAALLALSLCAEPQDTNKPAIGSDAARPAAEITKLDADFRAILDRLNNIEKALRSNDDQHKKLLELLGETVQNQINDINKKLNALRTDVDELKRTRVSTSEKRNDLALATASVMLVNARPDMAMETIVNGASYRVEPNQNRIISVPAGALRVQVTATDAAARDRMVQAGATHVVTLR